MSGWKLIATFYKQIMTSDIQNRLPFKEQANAINAALLKPLGECKLPAPLERVPLESDSPEILRVTEQHVQRALDVLNPRKACGPDRTPSWLLKEYTTWWPIPSRKSWMPPPLNSVFLPSGKWLTWLPFPKRNQWSKSKRNWDRYPCPPVFLKWRKSSSWMVSWNLRSWTSSMTTSTEPSQIP